MCRPWCLASRTERLSLHGGVLASLMGEISCAGKAVAYCTCTGVPVLLLGLVSPRCWIWFLNGAPLAHLSGVVRSEAVYCARPLLQNQDGSRPSSAPADATGKRAKVDHAGTWTAAAPPQPKPVNNASAGVAPRQPPTERRAAA